MVGGMIGWFGGQQLIGTAAVGSQDRWLVGTAVSLQGTWFDGLDMDSYEVCWLGCWSTSSPYKITYY